ncbi:hypothetical protein B0H11DRAFT_2284361 [Mycena galericulata]|nr:hypothetical protein B0H11DRAFT_2284361 [Mycena galericulata]
MSPVSAEETRRLFGPVNRPDRHSNVRHRALLRKALELIPQQDLNDIFGTPTHLRITMGNAHNLSLGKIYSNTMRNDRLVMRETQPPDPQVQRALMAYRTAYDIYHKKNGNDYAVRSPKHKHVLQEAEQDWADFAVIYLAARGRLRPDWALEPLPGFERVRVPPAHPPAPAPAPRAPRARAPAPHATPSTVQTPSRRHAQLALPTPPPSSPVRSSATAPAVGSSRHHIELADDHQDGRYLPRKRKLLEIIDISDSEVEEEDAHSQKKLKFLGYIDLSN